MNGQTRANIRSGFRLRVQSPGGVGGLRPLPSSYCAISGPARAKSASAARRRDDVGGVPELPFGKVPRTARGAGRAQQLVLRQEVGELTLPGGYSLRHAGRVRLPTVPVLATLRPDRLTRRPDGHTTFLAAREACIPRRRSTPNSLADTRRDSLLDLSPSPSGRSCRTPYGVDARRAFRAGKKNFFPDAWKKNFFSSRKNFGIGKFFPQVRDVMILPDSPKIPENPRNPMDFQFLQIFAKIFKI